MRQGRVHRFLRGRRRVDYWSVPHFLFGTVTALFTIVFVLPAGSMLLVTAALAIFWELLEKRLGLREGEGNSVTDVLLALFSFGITFALIDRTDPNPEHHSALLIVTVILYLSVNFFAWRARFDHDREFQG
ncbi:MAG: hypothetical protein WAV46_00760 [Candidatus Moraniibacteriota bacterium]